MDSYVVFLHILLTTKLCKCINNMPTEKRSPNSDRYRMATHDKIHRYKKLTKRKRVIYNHE